MTVSEGTGRPHHPEGIDAPRVTVWFEQHVAGTVPPLTFELIAGGRSNLTFVVTGADGARYVLRRPPTSHLLPTAHDMAREHLIISAMGPAGLPVPTALGLCQDEAVNSAPFYVMGFADGFVLRDAREAETRLDEPTRQAAGLALVDTLAQLHSLDVDAIGLGDLARREGYIARQLKRWYGQYQSSRDSLGGEGSEAVDRVHAGLVETIPEQGPATVVHGDYRLDNVVVSGDGRIVAVLDWELCTLGDPLADLAGLLAYWAEPGEDSVLGATAPTTAPGFPTRQEVIARYAAASGRDLVDLDFYMSFAYWKLACILEGVYARYKGGAMGDDAFDFTIYPTLIASLAGQAEEAMARLA